MQNMYETNVEDVGNVRDKGYVGYQCRRLMQEIQETGVGDVGGVEDVGDDVRDEGD